MSALARSTVESCPTSRAGTRFRRPIESSVSTPGTVRLRNRNASSLEKIVAYSWLSTPRGFALPCRRTARPSFEKVTAPAKVAGLPLAKFMIWPSKPQRRMRPSGHWQHLASLSGWHFTGAAKRLRSPRHRRCLKTTKLHNRKCHRTTQHQSRDRRATTVAHKTWSLKTKRRQGSNSRSNRPPIFRSRPLRRNRSKQKLIRAFWQFPNPSAIATKLIFGSLAHILVSYAGDSHQTLTIYVSLNQERLV